MSEPSRTISNEKTGSFSTKPRKDFLNYFGKDRWIHLWLAEKRTRLVAAVVPRFDRLGLAPDTISYVGLALLVGVIFYFVRNPLLACLFLAGNLVCDAFDGAYARYTERASQSGAFTDLVCDQVGMVAVAMMAVFHNLVPPLLGTVYISLYLIVVVFGVIINVMNLGSRITLTSKYFLYIVFGIWAYWEVNFFSLLMSVFSGLMAVEVGIGYFRLKRGIRKKFDTPVRFTEGDPYSSKLNYALNVLVPVSVLLAIVAGANRIPVRAVLDSPKLLVQWREGPVIVPKREQGAILGVGVRGKRFLLLTRGKDGVLGIREYAPEGGDSTGYFVLPRYLDPACDTLPVDGDLLLMADRSTHLLMGIDLDASFSQGRAVTVLTLPMGHLRVTAMAACHWEGKRVWLAANHLYTRRTYVVNPATAVKEGSLLGGLEASYVNGAFPSGLTALDGLVVALNRSSFNSVLYVASLAKLTSGAELIDASKTSFSPPSPGCLGPVIVGEDLVMLSPRGRVFRLATKVFLSARDGSVPLRAWISELSHPFTVAK